MKSRITKTVALAALMAGTAGVANATEGWYGRADVGYSFEGDFAITDGLDLGRPGRSRERLDPASRARLRVPNGFRLEGEIRAPLQPNRSHADDRARRRRPRLGGDDEPLLRLQSRRLRRAVHRRRRRRRAHQCERARHAAPAHPSMMPTPSLPIKRWPASTSRSPSASSSTSAIAGSSRAERARSSARHGAVMGCLLRQPGRDARPALAVRARLSRRRRLRPRRRLRHLRRRLRRRSRRARSRSSSSTSSGTARTSTKRRSKPSMRP